MLWCVVNAKKGLQSSEVVERTLAVVGLTHSWTVTGCSAHPNAHVSSSLRARFFRPCALPLPREPEQRQEVRDIVESMKREVAQDEWHNHWRECVHCEVEQGSQDIQQGLYKLNMHAGRPELFFAEAGRTGSRKTESSVAPSFSVNVFGDTYSLLAIVYSVMGGLHYTNQTYLPTEKCWIIYDDCGDSEATHAHSFDPDYKPGEEYLFVYMRTDLLLNLGCRHESPVAEPQLNASAAGGTGAQNGGSSSGFKRKFGIGEGDMRRETGGSSSELRSTQAVSH